MNPIISLSHPFGVMQPLYPGTPQPVVTSHRSISAGDTANTSLLTIHSHTGTHIDVPYHFCPDGDLLASFFQHDRLIIDQARLIDIPADPDMQITTEMIAPHITDMHSISGLLVRTGSGRYRETSPETYVMHTPYIHPDVSALLKKCCPSLKILGIDTISIANPNQKETGRLAHRAFLCDKPPILLIEDMNLAPWEKDKAGPCKLDIFPISTSLSDGAPVIVICSFYSNGTTF